jgi:hypothetical protein
MSSSLEARPGYVVPRYRAPDDAIWYHVLHGNVPGHQIDFMYCPEVPHGAFSQTHFGHLARLMKYIEPREHAPYAFALGNLSRDDVQHEPGHGGIALIFGLRVEGVLDHAGRAMPPYAHGIVAVDRALDQTTLRSAALTLHQHLLPGDNQSRGDASGKLYRRYARAARRSPETVERLLRKYIDGFTALPRPEPSRLTWSYIADEPAPPERVTIVHPDDEPFTSIARTAARLGAMLYRSNLKWTTISSGREPTIAGGVSIRFVPASEATADPTGLVVPIEDIPGDEATMAQVLFGVRPRAAAARPVRVGWRERDAAQKAAEAAAPERQKRGGRARGVTLPHGPAQLDPDEMECDLQEGEPARQTRLWIGWLALGAAAAGACAMAAIFKATTETAPGATASAAVSAAPPPTAVGAAPMEPTLDAGRASPSRRLDVTRSTAVGSERANRRAKDDGASTPDKATSPRASSTTAPGAIGGKPRF